jgi:pyruvate kinase
MLRTKVVCTLGPATSSPEAIRGLVRGGMDIARVNMSHGGREDHVEVIETVRTAAEEARRPVAILVDLAGPKIRVGELSQGLQLSVGATVVLAPEDSARSDEIPTTYAELAADLQAGDTVLMDDGLLEFTCVGVERDRALLQVVRGGLLKSRKGINVTTVALRTPSLTEKDLIDLDFALEHKVDYIGLSFVRSAEDVTDLKKRVGMKALVVAKIEKVQALQTIEEVMAETDAVMVARGDLGVELPFERVPLAQKRIIQLANYYGRPVITATQMLESMIKHARPTRAEASDVANAILDGTDAVMLSGETAVGDFPFEALNALVRIGTEIERSGFLERGPRYLTRPGPKSRRGASSREHAVASATVEAARQIGAPAIIVITRSGFSARLVSSYRPAVPVFAVTTERATYFQLAAVWGVQAAHADGIEVTYDALTQFGRECVLASGVGEPGASIVVTAGVPFHESGTTNTMRLERL